MDIYRESDIFILLNFVEDEQAVASIYKHTM